VDSVSSPTQSSHSVHAVNGPICCESIQNIKIAVHFLTSHLTLAIDPSRKSKSRM
jgi:hypothetical protein